MSTQTPTIGRIVQYRLSTGDAEAINRRRADAESYHRDPNAPYRVNNGTQVHTGNRVSAGDVYPLIITRVWGLDLDAQAPTEERLINGQVLLDGNDTYWATSVSEGTGERQYQWPYVGPKPAVVVELSPHDRKVLNDAVSTATTLSGRGIA